MKKLITVMVVGIMAACGSPSSSSTTDTTTVKTDSPTMAVPDSSRVLDSTRKLIDTAKPK